MVNKPQNMLLIYAICFYKKIQTNILKHEHTTHHSNRCLITHMAKLWIMEKVCPLTNFSSKITIGKKL